MVLRLGISLVITKNMRTCYRVFIVVIIVISLLFYLYHWIISRKDYSPIKFNFPFRIRNFISEISHHSGWRKHEIQLGRKAGTNLPTCAQNLKNKREHKREILFFLELEHNFSHQIFQEKGLQVGKIHP